MMARKESTSWRDQAASRLHSLQMSGSARLGKAVSPPLRKTGLGLVRDLHDCWLLANETHGLPCRTGPSRQCTAGREDAVLVERVNHQHERQRSWLLTRIKRLDPHRRDDDA